MKCMLKDATKLATRARINGVDWVVVAGDEIVSLRRQSADRDPRVCYDEMKFGAVQEVQLKDGCVTAYRSDGKTVGPVTMWLFREVAISLAEEELGTASSKNCSPAQLQPGAYWYVAAGQNPVICEKRAGEDFVRFANGGRQSWARNQDRFEGPLPPPTN